MALFSKPKESTSLSRQASDASRKQRPAMDRSATSPDQQPPATLGKAILKKRSAASLLSVASDVTVTAIPARSPTIKKFSSLRNQLVSFTENSEGAEEDAEAKLESYLIRCGMRTHPFVKSAPYMQAYEAMQLENDQYSDLLLRRLYPNHTPTFQVFKKPPATVLDLGCGEGHWAMYAASCWKNVKITLLDIVNVTLDDINDKDTPNIKFVHGNFLKRLPFEDNSFEFVRMANLGLCIRYQDWNAVIQEVFRVLTVNGRLELIDDQLMFPYGSDPLSKPDHASVPPTPTASISTAFLDDSDESDDLLDDDTETLASDEACHSETASTLVDSDASSASSHEKQLVVDADGLHLDQDLNPPVFVPWSERQLESDQLETVFQQMIDERFKVHPRPSTFLHDVVQGIFGEDNSSKASFHIKLPERGIEKNKKSIWTKKKSKELNIMELGVPESLNAKSAAKLGISYTALAAAAAASAKPQSPPQINYPIPSGLILHPSTFIPMSSIEVEMHVCKHMHSLLGTKPALRDYVRSEFEMDDASFEERIWNYETFLRRRLNWRSDSGLDDDEVKPKRLSDPYPVGSLSLDLTAVRCIRMYGCVKT
ncbi:hypothetical protein C8J56DRAFT_882809 [Mycena floridula]|nr:hypothetical protein C8J56DRAFT_882809 [Mycena floridula]